MRITNFGGNVSFVPKHIYTPQNEAEVLDILNRHSTGKIRVVASGHAWSNVTESKDVIIDMRNINKIDIERRENGEVWANVGAGCVLQRLLDTLHHETDYTLPTMGGIKKQTIAGAISTGTHGSGHPSLSHYMQEIRVAAYDPATKRAKVYEWTEGRGLLAARCAVGCMGVILSVKFRCVPKYYVAQSIEKRNSLKEILADKEKYKLQQFILVPYCWKYYVYTRHVSEGAPHGRELLYAYWIRFLSLVGTDIGLHLFLKTLVLAGAARKGVSGAVRRFYASLLPLFIERKRMVNDFSENALTLHHDLFQHLEMEIFIPEHSISKATDVIRHITAVFAGVQESTPDEVATQLETIGRLEELMRHKGYYTQHYPIYFRQVLPDETLISMTSGAQEWYFSVSFFTYLSPGRREHFYEFVAFVARCLTELYDARLHWGKYYPLLHEDIAHVFPYLKEFHQICRSVDPNGVFQNDFARRVLGFYESNI